MARAPLIVALCLLGCSRSSNEPGKGSGSGGGSASAAVVGDDGGPGVDGADGADGADGGGPTGATTERAPPTKVLQVAVVGRVGCARRADGRVRCWGRQWDGARAPTQAAPVEVPALDDAVAIDHALAGTLYVVTGDGTLRRGALELSKPVSLTAVADVADAIDVRAVGADALVLTRTGNVLLASKGAAPLVGDIVELGPSTGGPLALLERGGGVRTWSAGKLGTVRGLDDAIALVGDRCARRRGDQLACWDRDGRPTPWNGPGNIIDRVTGRGFRCDLTASGVACEGANDVGQLGTGPGPDRKDPRAVDLPAKPLALAAGERSVCAVLDSGEVGCWGANEAGQLGDGTLVNRPTPVVIAGLTTPTPPPPSDGLAAVQEASAAMDWSGLPAGCTRPTGMRGPGAEQLARVTSAYAYAGPSGVRVWLADYRLEPGGYRSTSRPARGNQVAFEIALWRGPNPRKSKPIDRGRYRDQGPRRAALTIHEGEVSGTYGEADVLVETIDKTWICGHLLAPGDITKRAPFAARFHDHVR